MKLQKMFELDEKFATLYIPYNMSEIDEKEFEEHPIGKEMIALHEKLYKADIEWLIGELTLADTYEILDEEDRAKFLEILESH